MDKQTLYRAFSAARFDRFLACSEEDVEKSLALYQSNVRLLGRMLSVLSIFEVVLRNAIDKQYLNQFGNDWFIWQSGAGGFLSKPGCEKSCRNVKEVIQKLNLSYTHDRAVASLSFGFWRYLFAAKEFKAASSTLLKIFPQKPVGLTYNETYVFNTLQEVNKIRNRIAHHEPICFASWRPRKSCWPSIQAYLAIKEIFEWLDFDPQMLLAETDFVVEELKIMVK